MRVGMWSATPILPHVLSTSRAELPQISDHPFCLLSHSSLVTPSGQWVTVLTSTQSILVLYLRIGPPPPHRPFGISIHFPLNRSPSPTPFSPKDGFSYCTRFQVQSLLRSHDVYLVIPVLYLTPYLRPSVLRPPLLAPVQTLTDLESEVEL